MLNWTSRTSALPASNSVPVKPQVNSTTARYPSGFKTASSTTNLAQYLDSLESTTATTPLTQRRPTTQTISSISALTSFQGSTQTKCGKDLVKKLRKSIKRISKTSARTSKNNSATARNSLRVTRLLSETSLLPLLFSHTFTMTLSQAVLISPTRASRSFLNTSMLLLMLTTSKVNSPYTSPTAPLLPYET